MRVDLVYFLCVISLGLVDVALGSNLKPVSGAEFITTYSVTNSKIGAKTKDQSVSSHGFDIVTTYPFDKMARHLESFPFIMNITRHLSKEFKPKKQTWTSYFEYKRESTVFIKLALSKPVTIMMSLQEEYIECVAQEEQKPSYGGHSRHGPYGYGGSSYSSSSSCRPDSNFKLKGPIKVYSESLVGSEDIKDLLKGQIEIKSKFSRSMKDELIVDTSMKKPKEFFSLTYETLNKLQVPINWNSSREGIYKPMSGRGYMSESQISLSIARFFRLANERLLKQINDEDRRGEE